MNTYELVAQTQRNGQVESQHFGTVVALNADGSVAFSVTCEGVEVATGSLVPPAP